MGYASRKTMDQQNAVVVSIKEKRGAGRMSKAGILLRSHQLSSLRAHCAQLPIWTTLVVFVTFPFCLADPYDNKQRRIICIRFMFAPVMDWVEQMKEN